MSSGSSASRRAGALASAALASARSSSGRARATPIHSSLSLLSPEARDVARYGFKPSRSSAAKRNRDVEQPDDRFGSEDDALQSATIEDDTHDGLSSRQRRLSRAARFGAATANAQPISLPESWDESVVRILDESDKATLRRDYLRAVESGPSKTMTPQRSTVLHLTSASPHRYASVRSVLRHVRNRLGADQEHEWDNALRDQWTPARIVEYGCGAGEGLWAAAHVFGEDTKGLRYDGYDTQTPLLRVAREIVEAAKISASSVLQGRGIDDGGQDLALQALLDMQISFASPSWQVKQRAVEEEEEDLDSTEAKAEPMEGNGTLIVCNHSLSSMKNDAARNRFVKSLWTQHPTAEVIVLIESGNERGFACIASAREQLLGIGSEDNEHVCHVVAPCPHDKPCPLLHDFEQTLTSPSSSRQSVGRSQAASSPLFHGARVGLKVCSSPLRVHVPNYSRLTRHAKRADETLNHSYLVVRRGARPNMLSEASNASSSAQHAFQLHQLRQRQSTRTKEGILDPLRTGSPLQQKADIPLAEEIGDGETGETEDQEQARDELLRMLPEILQQQMQQEGDATPGDIPEAMREAHKLFKQSAELAEAEDDVEVNESSSLEAESMELASAMLESQRMLNAEDQAGESHDEEQVPFLHLTQQDIESMRLESYDWPRLVRPPIKRSGHVIVDACTAQGSVDRFTLTRSMGRQLYQDARKASHGDLLPYAPITEEPSEQGGKAEAEAETIEVQNVKSLINCVPSAEVSQRNMLPAHEKIKDSVKTKKGHRGGKLKSGKFIMWPESSALAIGPDLVAGGSGSGGSARAGDGTMLDLSAASPQQKSAPFSRRNHYTSGGGRAMEQLNTSKGIYVARQSRKQSLSDYSQEVDEGWATLPGEDEADEATDSFDSAHHRG